MPWTDQHLKWLKKTKEVVKTADGKPIIVWEFQHRADGKVLTSWAKHFRNHYCFDTEIDAMRKGTSLSRAEYLTAIKLPDRTRPPGPSIRAGDFTEILVADYLQYVLGYWVPRLRYGRKMIRNESSKGCDTLAFRFVKGSAESSDDVLAIFKRKADLSSKKPSGRLQEAVNDSIKDQVRKAESLNAMKQFLLDRRLGDDAMKVERFQCIEDRPYKERFGAVALISHDSYCPKTLGDTSTANHPHNKNLDLVVIRGKDLMSLVHDLYQRASDEA